MTITRGKSGSQIVNGYWHIAVAIVATAVSYGATVTVRAGFTNVTVEAGFNYVQNRGMGGGPLLMTGGAAAGDFDNDGWVDLFVTRLDASDILYRNKGDGTFDDVSATAGFSANLRTNAPAWGDIDNDGDLDLYVTSSADTRFYLYVNDGTGRFTEQADERGAAIAGPLRYGQSVAFGDYDGDGYLDIHTNDWGNEISASTSRMLRNVGGANPGYYEDVTVAAGLDEYRPPQFYNGATNEKTYRFTSIFTDLDRDGYRDLLIAGDFTTSQVFWNDGDGTFTDGTLAAGIGTGQDSMGLTVGDYNGDGLLDFFESNLVNVPGQIEDHGGNRLFRNNGDRTFSDATDEGGVRDSGWSWGTTFLDYDNDRDLDLAVTNGWPFVIGQSHLYENQDNVFRDVSNDVGITNMQMGRGLLSFDYDNDGDLDIFVTNHGEPPVLYRNDGGYGNAWLRIELEGTISNRDAIGALIEVDPVIAVNGDEMVRELNGGSNFLSQNEPVAHFGLGQTVTNVERLTVMWPSGIVQELNNVAPNQLLRLKESGVLGDFDQNGAVDGNDFLRWQTGDTPHAWSAFDYKLWLANVAQSNPTPSAEVAVPEPRRSGVWICVAVAVLVFRFHSELGLKVA